MSKPYQDICDDLVQVAVRFEMARREHERALAECARVRRQLPPGVPMTPRHTASFLLIATHGLSELAKIHDDGISQSRCSTRPSARQRSFATTTQKAGSS